MGVEASAQGVVFDLDGVLVLSEHLWEAAWIDYSARHRYAWTADDTRRCQGMSVPEWAAHLGTCTSSDPARAADEVIGDVAAAYRAGEVPLIDGALELVAAMAARVPVGLASSAPRAIIDTVMDTMGLGPYFSASVSSAEVDRGKPSPDVYLEAARRLGIDPNRSVAVEDSSNGIRAAAAAGLAVIAIAHEAYPIAPDAIALTVAVHTALRGAEADLERVLRGRAQGGLMP